MFGPMHYASSKIGHAIFVLMTYPGDLRQRFATVEAMGCLAALNERDFPEELRGDWHRLIGALYPTPAKLKAIRREVFSGEFIAKRTPAEIDPRRIEEWACALLNFHEELQTYDPEKLREKRQKGLLT